MALEGIGDNWRHTGTIAAEAWNAGLRSGMTEVKEKEWRRPDDYMPHIDEAPKRKRKTLQESEAAIAARYG